MQAKQHSSKQININRKVRVTDERTGSQNARKSINQKCKVYAHLTFRPSQSAWEKEDADLVGSEESWWQVPIELSPDDAAVAMNLGDCAPVLLSLGLLADDWRANLLADIEFSLFLGVDTFDLKKSLGWVQGALVPAERCEASVDVETWFLRRHIGKAMAGRLKPISSLSIFCLRKQLFLKG